MLTETFPYLFDPTHAEVEAAGLAFRAEGAMRARVQALAAAGFLASAGEGSVRRLALLRAGLAYHDPLNDLGLIIQELGAVPLCLAGGFDDVVAAARRGERVLAFALTEPGAGSDVKALSTRARPAGDGWRLTGTKWFISNAPDADTAVVFARTDDGIGAFLVERPPAAAQSVAGHSVGRFDFDDTPARLVSPRGLPLALATLERCRPTVGLAAWGMARRAFDETVRHVSTRSQFGAPLAALPVVAGRIADMALELEGSVHPALHACWLRDRTPGARTGYESAVGKVLATEAAFRVIDTAVQLHGAEGVEESSVVQRLYRDIRPLRIYEGATDVLRTLVAARWLPGAGR